MADDGLSPLSIVRQSAKLSGAKIAGAVFMVPVTLVVARVLGPRLTGVVGLVTLWQLYANLLKPAMFSAAFREMPGLIKRGDSSAAERLQNIGITAESIYLLLPIAAFVGGALVQRDPMIRNALLVGAAAFVLSQVNYFVELVQWAHQRYGLIASANMAALIVAAGFVGVSLWRLGIYAAILIPAVTAGTSTVLYLVKAAPLGFRPTWNWAESRRLLTIGIPLALGTIFYWAFRMTDRTIVAAIMPLTALGYLSFSMQFIDSGIKLVSDFQNVLAMRVWSLLGHEPHEPLGAPARRLSLTVLVVTCVAINLTQATFGAFVHLVVPAFLPAVPVLEILAVLLTAGTAGMLPLTILNSPGVNRQKMASAIFGVGVPANAVLVFLGIHYGYGLVGVATATVIAQSLVAIALIVAAQDQLFRPGEKRVPFFAVMLGIYALSIGIDVAYHIEPLRLGTDSHILQASALRCAIALAVWIPVLIVFMRVRWPALGTGPATVPASVS